ncbi:30562_t:CDS:2, partial [Racocetra persica]
NDGNFFDNYEEEEIKKVESYCTNSSTDNEDLYINPERIIMELVQVETLDEEQKEKATYLL